MNKRQFLKGMAATAAGILVPGHVLGGQYEFHQRVPGLRSASESIPESTPNTGHGPQILIHGDAQLGYYGFVPASDLITGDALASAIGLREGVAQFSDAGWFKYSYDGNTRYVAKKTFRYAIRWREIYQCGAVYGTFNDGSNPFGTERSQDAVVTIDGLDYVVKLMQGLNGDPSTLSTGGWDLPETHRSEWNRVFYRLHNGVHAGNHNTLASETSQPNFAQWGSYSDAELHMHYNFGNGSSSWCQETPATTTNRVYRGYAGVSRADNHSATLTGPSDGWRPVLEVL